MQVLHPTKTICLENPSGVFDALHNLARLAELKSMESTGRPGK